jgi:hypothetical protein
MRWVELNASLVCYYGSRIALQFLKHDGAIEVQQRIVGEMRQRDVEDRQRLLAFGLGLAYA